MQVKHLFWVLVLPLLAMGGCAHAPGPSSVAGGECKFLERPAYAVRGAKRYDQDWIDSTVEGGVGACGWQRPAPRPAGMDAQMIPVKAKPAQKQKAAWLGFLHGLRKKPVAAPVEAAPATVEPETAPVPEPAPIPAPKRPIDELLGVFQK